MTLECLSVFGSGRRAVVGGRGEKTGRGRDGLGKFAYFCGVPARGRWRRSRGRGFVYVYLNYI